MNDNAAHSLQLQPDELSVLGRLTGLTSSDLSARLDLVQKASSPLPSDMSSLLFSLINSSDIAVEIYCRAREKLVTLRRSLGEKDIDT